MCRWAAWIGAPIFLDEIILKPAQSLVAQSHHAAECKTATNADGFGLAWYGERPEPGLYRDVYPAWSDPNLRSIAGQVRSGLFLAHVRASTGTATSRNNCHPFVHGRWSFMHNGQIGGFEGFRRRADMLIPDALYA
ncbi:MAG: class II glutamine amidotransferase, partial [Rubricella sp.]